MGHSRLSNLPRTRWWNEVVELIAQGGSVADVAEKTLDAALDGFSAAANDRGVIQACWLLMQVPLIAQGEDGLERLAEIGIRLPTDASPTDLAAALTDAADEYHHVSRSRSDLGEMAELALVESFHSALWEENATLFGPSAADLRVALKRLGSQRSFQSLTRTFFANLTKRFLSYFLSRTLSNHVGPEKRFHSINERLAFDEALGIHCWEASRIVESYASEWRAKMAYHVGHLNPEDVVGFLKKSTKKLAAELVRRGAP